MTANLVLAHPQPGHAERVSGIICPACSERLGFAFRPLVTIAPQRAMRLPSGAILIENPTVLCAGCQRFGIETVL